METDAAETRERGFIVDRFHDCVEKGKILGEIGTVLMCCFNLDNPPAVFPDTNIFIGFFQRLEYLVELSKNDRQGNHIVFRCAPHVGVELTKKKDEFQSELKKPKEPQPRQHALKAAIHEHLGLEESRAARLSLIRNIQNSLDMIRERFVITTLMQQRRLNGSRGDYRILDEIYEHAEDNHMESVFVLSNDKGMVRVATTTYGKDGGDTGEMEVLIDYFKKRQLPVRQEEERVRHSSQPKSSTSAFSGGMRRDSRYVRDRGGGAADSGIRRRRRSPKLEIDPVPAKKLEFNSSSLNPAAVSGQNSQASHPEAQPKYRIEYNYSTTAAERRERRVGFSFDFLLHFR